MEKIYLIVLVITLIIIPSIVIYLNTKFDLFIKKNTFNCLCQKEKVNKLEEKGYFSDKLKAKKYLEKEFPEIKYAKVIYSTSNPEDLRKIKIPDRYVMKYSTGARMFHIGSKQDEINDIVDKAKYYKSIKFSSYGYRSLPFFNFKEPHYDYNKEPKIFIEEFIEGIKEFRIMMANGKILYCEKITKQTEIFNQEWKQISDPITDGFVNLINKEKPKCLDKIIQFCYEFYEKEKFDLIRMDFYLNEKEDDFYFGEFTFTPENCRKKYSNQFNSKHKELFT